MLPPRPLIAVPWPQPDYVAALDRAGATVRELAAGAEPSTALDGCDGLLLTGGADVDPRKYGETERHPSVHVDDARDALELPLARRALERDLPLLAICRGMQVLNVAAGGTLVQDLPSARPSAVHHRVPEPRTAPAHDIDVTRGTCVARLLGGRDAPGLRLTVNSRHHQALRDTAPGFVASATAPDGIVEAIERPDLRFCVGVQWHPENFWATGEFAPLFAAFVDAARRHHASR